MIGLGEPLKAVPNYNELEKVPGLRLEIADQLLETLVISKLEKTCTADKICENDN